MFTSQSPRCVFIAAPMYTPKTRLSSDQVAIVAKDLTWIPIDQAAPFGAKCLLISKAAGMPQVGTLQHRDQFFDHWFPLPTFKKEANHVRQTSNAGGTDDPPVDSTQA